jgi:hypothetical protein
VVLRGDKPIFAAECETGERKLSRNISCFAPRAGIPNFYQVHLGSEDVADSRARILPFAAFAKILGV